jgi:hypothetical protein
LNCSSFEAEGILNDVSERRLYLSLGCGQVLLLRWPQIKAWKLVDCKVEDDRSLKFETLRLSEFKAVVADCIILRD